MPRDAIPLSLRCSMFDFRIDPPLVVKDTRKTRPLGSLAEAGAFVEGAMRLGRPPPWRNMYERLRAVRSEEVAIEVIGALRELLEHGRSARTAKARFHTA
jgi:hypothetical protein